jgi:hypothetical protein
LLLLLQQLQLLLQPLLQLASAAQGYTPGLSVLVHFQVWQRHVLGGGASWVLEQHLQQLCHLRCFGCHAQLCDPALSLAVPCDQTLPHPQAPLLSHLLLRLPPLLLLLLLLLGFLIL